MSTFKSALALFIMISGLVITGLIYLQSPAASISVGALCFIVFVSFVVDNRAQIFHMEITQQDENGKAKKSKVGVALHQSALMARVQDGDIKGL